MALPSSTLNSQQIWPLCQWELWERFFGTKSSHWGILTLPLNATFRCDYIIAITVICILVIRKCFSNNMLVTLYNCTFDFSLMDSNGL